MESIFEDQRAIHEERDRLVDTMTREWMHDKRTHKERINSDHRIKLLLQRYIDATHRLHTVYVRDDTSRQTESRAIGGPNEFAEFYARLKALKESHRKTGQDAKAQTLSIEFNEMNLMIENPNRVDTEMVAFTDEEGYGKYLDMNTLYLKFINLKGVKRTDYLTWLGEFDQLYELNKETTKRTADYKKYLVAIVIYLIDFTSRVRPLMNIVREREDCLKAFEAAWKENNFIGWLAEDSKHGALKHTVAAGGAHLDLSPYSSPVELQCVGMERMKAALQALGLKCGGTSQERAQRLFATKGKKLEELDASLFAAGGNAASSMKASADGAEKRERERQKAIATLEAQVYHFVELLSEEREATRENVMRKQARTAGEIEEDEEEAEAAAAAANASDDEVDVDVPYNPKNLPLGWDGKPIPYWLYKLHGLNISYPCEICGNQVYKGPKAFSLHFSEWRHSHGMRCLGIPNTMHFANITKIADAIQLWKKMCEQKENEKFNPHTDEEFEDSAGNVITRKIYEDLKRQGLL